ncbi:hypothetical protein GUJ93_ZPchr0006g42084 [Zizania palustris]|uniref:Uncharacterized protein n=1 Tax=Zizania palustris TaxID=103762 RepID=A0A8J5SDH7_ZIZPA|nr:hypothetical protein GUJ93_ZPchr0006g42084 [Zizania palustris]
MADSTSRLDAELWPSMHAGTKDGSLAEASTCQRGRRSGALSAISSSRPAMVPLISTRQQLLPLPDPSVALPPATPVHRLKRRFQPLHSVPSCVTSLLDSSSLIKVKTGIDVRQ